MPSSESVECRMLGTCSYKRARWAVQNAHVRIACNRDMHKATYPPRVVARPQNHLSQTQTKSCLCYHRNRVRPCNSPGWTCRGQGEDRLCIAGSRNHWSRHKKTGRTVDCLSARSEIGHSRRVDPSRRRGRSGWAGLSPWLEKSKTEARL